MTPTQAEPKLRIYRAEFVKVAHAEAFAARLLEDPSAWRATDITHRPGRRLVTWVGPDTEQYRIDLAETVGYYGSPPQGPVATLDGRKTPRCW